MKTFNSYIIGLAATIAATAVLPSCQDHFDDPELGVAPVATISANTTIAELKELMWNTADNYCDTIFTRDWYNTPAEQRTEAMKTNGEHIVVSGRVISSDYAGNCFKYIVLQDATGALTFSINSYQLYLNYRRGQEVVVDLTGLYMGKYRGLEQVGFPSYNSSIPGYEASFMAPELFASHAQLNGFPDAAKIDTIVVEKFADLGVTPAELRKWQSQIVRFNNVEFVPNETTPTLSTYHSSGLTQQIKDSDGNTLDVRTSGYCNFWTTKLPEGKCDVVAILGYYMNLASSGGWQLTLIDINSIQNIGNPTVPKGSQTDPYSVLEAIAMQVNDQNQSGWVRGYIVGTVAPEVETITSNADIEWGNEPVLANTLVIGQTKETQDIAECVVIALPANSELRTYGALRENPDNYQKQIDVKGTFASVMGTYGVTNNSGTSSEFAIEGVNIGGGGSSTGNGSEESPYTCAQIIAMAPSSTTDATASGVWVSGYIVGYYADYAAHFDASGTQYANILISDNPSAAAASDCVCVQLIASTDPRTALNLVDNPGNLGAQVSVYGDVMKYNTLPGIKNTSNYKLNGVNPNPPSTDGVTTKLLDATDATALDNWTLENVNLPSAATYIWNWRDYNGAYYLNASAYVSGANYESEAWAISPVLDFSTVKTAMVAFEHAAKFQTTLTSLCGFGVREEGTTTWNMINIPTWPTAGSWTFANSGNIDLGSYVGKRIQVAFKYASTADGADTWEIRNLVFTTDAAFNVEGGGGGTVDPDPTPDPTAYKGDFNTFNGGTAKSSYGTYTNSTGWTATNCAILNGGTTDGNPHFVFIGSETTMAPTLNGKTSTPGVVESPSLTGGIGTLTFSYGFPYSDTKCDVLIEILQNDQVVKSDLLSIQNFTTKMKFDYAFDVNVSGDFKIRITNQCASGKDSNCDRIAIFNLTWTE